MPSMSDVLDRCSCCVPAVVADGSVLLLFLQLLGLVGVRKALEWVFSPQELLWLDELMPEEERNVPEKGLEPGHSFSGSDSEDSELMYQPKAPEINISVN